MFNFSSACLLLITAESMGSAEQNQGFLIENIPQIALVESLLPSETAQASLPLSASLSAFLSFKLPEAQLRFDPMSNHDPLQNSIVRSITAIAYELDTNFCFSFLLL